MVKLPTLKLDILLLKQINMRYTNYFILSFFIILSSCDLILIEDIGSANARDNFNYLWEECNDKYAFFDIKNIDWDAVRVEYEARLNDNMQEEELFLLLGEMLNELKDGHVNLESNFNASFYPFEQLGQDNFDLRLVQDHYLPKSPHVSGGILNDFLANGEVGYIRYASFMTPVTDENFGFILDRFKNTKGLILDLRENGGGATTNMYAMLSRFVDNKTTVAQSRIKNGPERNDFSDLEDVMIEPTDGTRYTNKVMVLVDRGSYSATSFFALATKAIPNMVLVGDTTGGGLGAPNGGQLPNGWTYRFSITQTLDLDGTNYENGVPVDIEAFLDLDDRTTDEVIERALLELL